MIIIQDSREQNPLTFVNKLITEVRIEALSVGDYGVEYKHGWQCPAVFERKSMGDLFGTLGKGYDRFKRELERARASELQLIIIIEGSFSQVLMGYEHSTMKGISIVRKLFTLWIKYGVPFICCSDRSEMATYITEYYASVGRKAVRDLKAKKKVKADE